VERTVSLLHQLFGSRGDGDETEAFGDYRLTEKIADGRLSTLYRGAQVKTGQAVAVKVLSEYGCRVADKLTRKLRKEWEGERALRLKHPHVVHTITCGKQHGTYYIAMEFLAGGTLASLVQARAPQVEGRKIEIMRQAARGLEYVHSQGVIHRDISPRNVMLDARGTAKLIDFGVAANKDDRIRNTGQRTGRPAYMAPELIRTNRFSERTDVYAFGVSLYEVVTRQRPFRTSDDPFEALATALNTEIPRPSTLCPSVSQRLEAVIMRAIDPNPQRRYPTMTRLADELDRVTENDV
jgi:serine/threonine-protein kinase